MICGALAAWANQNSGHFEDSGFLFLAFVIELSIANAANILICVIFDDCDDESAAKLPG